MSSDKELREEQARRKKATEDAVALEEGLVISKGATGTSESLKFAAGSEADAKFTIWEFTQFLKSQLKDNFVIADEIANNESKYRVPFSHVGADKKFLLGVFVSPSCMSVYAEKGRPVFHVDTDNEKYLNCMVDSIVASLKKFGVPEPHEVNVHVASPEARKIIEARCKALGVKCSFDEAAENKASVAPANQDKPEGSLRPR